MVQYLKKHLYPTTELRRILTENTTIFEQQNTKQKLQMLEPNLIELILKPVLMYLNVFSYWRYLLKQIRKINDTQNNSINVHKNYITFVIDPPLMMAQSLAESTWEITSYGRFINQFSPNIIRSIQQIQKINKKNCKQNISIMFNQICINKEMLPKYTHTHTHIYMCVYVCVCVCDIIYP